MSRACKTCALKDQINDLLRDELRIARAERSTLTEHLVNLADPMALARVAAANRQAPERKEHVGEPRKPPVTSPGMLRVKRSDRPSEEERALLIERHKAALEAVKAEQKEQTVVSPGNRDEIEASFKATES